jgi:2-polyprenyl-3-methyl-5-hydroxy-6-metoxy-1,4-benzoquinol methylase
MFADRRRYIQPVIHRHFALDKDTPNLDLGCGHGAFVHVLRLNGFTSVGGVDVSEDQVVLAYQPWIHGITHGEEGIFAMRVRYVDLTHEQSFTPNFCKTVIEHDRFLEITAHDDKPVPMDS